MKLASPQFTYEQLIEKIVRAKIAIEDQRLGHVNGCMVDDDPDYMGPCTCGVSSKNRAIAAALEALRL